MWCRLNSQHLFEKWFIAIGVIGNCDACAGVLRMKTKKAARGLAPECRLHAIEIAVVPQLAITTLQQENPDGDVNRRGV
jgi:hypothetical protein